MGENVAPRAGTRDHAVRDGQRRVVSRRGQRRPVRVVEAEGQGAGGVVALLEVQQIHAKRAEPRARARAPGAALPALLRVAEVHPDDVPLAHGLPAAEGDRRLVVVDHVVAVASAGQHAAVQPHRLAAGQDDRAVAAQRAQQFVGPLQPFAAGEFEAREEALAPRQPEAGAAPRTAPLALDPLEVAVEGRELPLRRLEDEVAHPRAARGAGDLQEHLVQLVETLRVALGLEGQVVVAQHRLHHGGVAETPLQLHAQALLEREVLALAHAQHERLAAPEREARGHRRRAGLRRGRGGARRRAGRVGVGEETQLLPGAEGGEFETAGQPPGQPLGGELQQGARRGLEQLQGALAKVEAVVAPRREGLTVQQDALAARHDRERLQLHPPLSGFESGRHAIGEEIAIGRGDDTICRLGGHRSRRAGQQQQGCEQSARAHQGASPASVAGTSSRTVLASLST